MSLLNPSLPRGSPAGNVLKRMSKNAMPCGLPSAFVSSGAFDGTIGRSSDTTVPVFARAIAWRRFSAVMRFRAPS